MKNLTEIVKTPTSSRTNMLDFSGALYCFVDNLLEVVFFRLTKPQNSNLETNVWHQLIPEPFLDPRASSLFRHMMPILETRRPYIQLNFLD